MFNDINKTLDYQTTSCLRNVLQGLNVNNKKGTEPSCVCSRTHRGLSETCWLRFAPCLAAPPDTDPPFAQTILPMGQSQRWKKKNNLILQEVTITCSAKEQSDVVRKQLETPSELSATRDQCYCSSLSCYTLYTCILCYWNVYKHGHKWPSENAASTFSPVLPQLPILNETSKHLRLHEDTQETTDAFRRHGFTEGLSLKNALSALILSDKQGVMSDGLQKEADESLWHQAVQGVVLCQDKGKGINGKSETEKSQIIFFFSFSQIADVPMLFCRNVS